MTVTKEGAEPEISVTPVDAGAPVDPNMVTAVGVEETKKPDEQGMGGSNEPPIPDGHSRFYCSKCRSVSSRILTETGHLLSLFLFFHPVFRERFIPAGCICVPPSNSAPLQSCPWRAVRHYSFVYLTDKSRHTERK